MTTPAATLLYMTKPSRKTTIILSIVFGLIVVQLLLVGFVLLKLAHNSGRGGERNNSRQYGDGGFPAPAPVQYGQKAPPSPSRNKPTSASSTKTVPKPKPTGPQAAAPKFSVPAGVYSRMSTFDQITSSQRRIMQYASEVHESRAACS